MKKAILIIGKKPRTRSFFEAIKDNLKLNNVSIVNGDRLQHQYFPYKDLEPNTKIVVIDEIKKPAALDFIIMEIKQGFLKVQKSRQMPFIIQPQIIVFCSEYASEYVYHELKYQHLRHVEVIDLEESDSFKSALQKATQWFKN